MHPNFLNEVFVRCEFLYDNHWDEYVDRDMLFNYDNYVIFAYACPPQNKPKSPRDLIVIEEDGKSPWKYRKQSVIKIYRTDASMLRL